MTKLNHDKARQRDRTRAAAHQQKRRTGDDYRQLALSGFVAKHQISCFKCGTETARWAKTGISHRGPWAICSTCIEQAA